MSLLGLNRKAETPGLPTARVKAPRCDTAISRFFTGVASTSRHGKRDREGAYPLILSSHRRVSRTRAAFDPPTLPRATMSRSQNPSSPPFDSIQVTRAQFSLAHIWYHSSSFSLTPLKRCCLRFDDGFCPVGNDQVVEGVIT